MTGESRGGVMYFNPDADITRAEVMTVIGRLLPRGYAAASLNYRDASAIPSWAAEHVKTCVSAGIIGGYTDGTLLRSAGSRAARLPRCWRSCKAAP